MKIILDETIPERSGKSFVVNKGQHIKVIEVKGGQIVDFVVFNANNVRERFSQGRTKANQGKIFISTGDKLYSKSNNVMMTIVEDTYGTHDLQYGMCSRWIYESPDYRGFSADLKVGGELGRPRFGCWEILTQALKGWNIPSEDIPDPFNIFQTVGINLKTGEMKILTGKSKPGDYIDLKAEMNCLVGISACPSTGNPIRVQIYEE